MIPLHMIEIRRYTEPPPSPPPLPPLPPFPPFAPPGVSYDGECSAEVPMCVMHEDHDNTLCPENCYMDMEIEDALNPMACYGGEECSNGMNLCTCNLGDNIIDTLYFSKQGEADPQECADACAATDACQFALFRFKTGKCELLDSCERRTDTWMGSWGGVNMMKFGAEGMMKRQAASQAISASALLPNVQ